MKKLKLIFGAAFLSASVVAQVSDTSLFERRIFEHKGFHLPYRILYPENYNPSEKYPLIIFLHGSGERGDNNAKQLTHGAKMFVEKNRKQFPAVVVVPQCPEGLRWSGFKWEDRTTVYQSPKEATPPMAALCALVKQMTKQKYIDRKRVYIGGLSMGGMGTFDILWRMPTTFAAAFPICGAGDPSKVAGYAGRTSLWIFHGAKDEVVSPECSRTMYEALKKAGAKVRYTEYPEDGHDSWNSAFAENELMPWLFSK